MADNSLSPDLSPILWTTGVTAREPRKEDRGSRGNKGRRERSRLAVPSAAEAETSEPEATDDSPHELDSFA